MTIDFGSFELKGIDAVNYIKRNTGCFSEREKGFFCDFGAIKRLYDKELTEAVESYKTYGSFRYSNFIHEFKEAHVKNLNRPELYAFSSIYDSGLPFLPQFPKCGYFMDFYDPIHGVAIEIDGIAYHIDTEKDRKMEMVLIENGVKAFLRVPAISTLVGRDGIFESHEGMDYDTWYEDTMDGCRYYSENNKEAMECFRRKYLNMCTRLSPYCFDFLLSALKSRLNRKNIDGYDCLGELQLVLGKRMDELAEKYKRENRFRLK